MVVGHVGPEAASLLGAYFACGDLEELTALLESADLQVVERRTRMGRAQFDSVDGFVETEVKSTPLMDRISGETYQRILAGARNVLKPFTSPSRSLDLPFEGLLLVSRKRRAA
jgi:hypothetical protein